MRLSARLRCSSSVRIVQSYSLQPMSRIKAVSYSRVSTSDQAETGSSLAAQQAKIEQYAALYDIEIVAHEVDAGESSATLVRPALQRAFSTLRSGRATALIVVAMDRLTRSVADTQVIVKMFSGGRYTLLSVTEHLDTSTAMGRGMINLMASFGQMTREVIGEKTRAVKTYQRSQNRFLGGSIPFGYQLADDGTLTEVADEQMVIAEVRAMHAAGRSMRSIAATLRERGHQLGVGKIQRMLARRIGA